MAVVQDQGEGGAVLSLLCEQPALCLPCTIRVTEGRWGKGGVWRCGGGPEVSIQVPKYLGGESRGQRCCPASGTEISCFSLPLLQDAVEWTVILGRRLSSGQGGMVAQLDFGIPLYCAF